MQQRMDAQVGKTQPRGPLPAGGDRPVDWPASVLAEDAVVAHALHLDEPAIGGKADLAQLGEVGQVLADPEVIGVIDRGFGAQGPIFLVILLDARCSCKGCSRRGLRRG